MDTISRLFGSPTKAKMIKLFVFNPTLAFDADQVAERVKENVSKVRKEAAVLEKLKLIRKKSFSKTVERRVRRRKVSKKVKTHGWMLNENFAQLLPLQIFLVNINHLSPKEISRTLQKTGTIKLIVAAGIFIQDPESRVDLLVVGDNIRKSVLENAVKTIESEIGKEIRYAYFETADFKYRLGLYDKLIRDILDYPHEIVVNKLGSI